MARRVRTAFRKLKKRRPDVYVAVQGTGHLTSTQVLNKLKKGRIKPIIPQSELHGMARRASFRSGTPIKITKDMGEGHRFASGLATRKDDKVSVKLHPVLQYNDRRYVADVIGHELDHAKVVKRSIRRQKARQKKKKHGYY